MKYYKNTEIATLFHVSEKAVRNWIESSQQGKLDLELYEKNNRFFVANTSKNIQIIEELVADRKKFKNSRAFKVVTPKPEFYEHFMARETIDILNSIDVHSEIPLQYSYFNGGAKEWQRYVKRLLNEEAPNTIASTIELLRLNQDYLNYIVKQKSIHIIDLGPGDGTPVKDFIKYLLDNGRTVQYSAVDLSQEMLKIVSHNIHAWFEGKVKTNTYVRDLNSEPLTDIFLDDLYGEAQKESMHLALLLGGTLSNLRLPEHTLRIINNSLGRNDLLLYSLKIDSESSRRYFDFHTGAREYALGAQLRFVPDLLGINESYYEVEQYYDEQQRCRFTRIKLKTEIILKVVVRDVERSLTLEKGKTILLWRVRHKNPAEVITQFEQNGFDLLHTTLDASRGFMLMTSATKTGQQS